MMSRLASLALLAALPVVVALLAYYRPHLAGRPLPRTQGDATFYAYQLARAAECGGRWWRIAEDPRLGAPYPSEVAKHPGLYEGVDLMLLAAALGRGLPPDLLYHLAVLACLAGNGWAAAWLVRRETGSTAWAAAAAALITANTSVAEKIYGHLHLLKLGWVILAVAAFAGFLRRPRLASGVTLGAACALVLQGSFYYGYFVVVALPSLWLLALLSGRLRSDHAGATAAASATFLALGAAATFPVWSRARASLFSDQFFSRVWSDTWAFGAEAWQYLVPVESHLARLYFAQVRPQMQGKVMHEGWTFLGVTVLASLAAVGVARLRGTRVAVPGRSVVPVFLAAMGVLVLLSLAGGPSVFLYRVMPSFRCYGRAGVLALALGMVVAPIVLARVVRNRRGVTRLALGVAFAGLVVFDVLRPALAFRGWPTPGTEPAWVDWLREQPPGLRLAAFSPSQPKPFKWWGLNSLGRLHDHGHATLNGAELTLLEADLRLLGADYDRLNPEALRFLVSLGYEALAFDDAYLAANPWIADEPGLTRVATLGGWSVFRTGPAYVTYRAIDREALLRVAAGLGPRSAPARSWTTLALPLEGPCVATRPGWATWTWADADGRVLGKPRPALFQHAFGPGLPALTVETPGRPGRYALRLADAQGEEHVSIPFDVGEPRPGGPPPGAEALGVSVESGPGVTGAPSTLVVANRSDRHVPAQLSREQVGPSTRAHPALTLPFTGELPGALVLREAGAGPLPRAWPLPADLPPGATLRLPWPAGRPVPRPERTPARPDAVTPARIASGETPPSR
jgi:hypothetical protein